MYKKLVFISLLFLFFLGCGCEVNELNNNKTTVKLTTSDIKQLVGVTSSDIEKIYGFPEKSTYYINSNNLRNLKGNYITLRDFNHNSIVKSYYHTTNEDTFMILWYKNNKVINASFDDCDLLSNNNYSDEINNINIKIDYFNTSSSLKYNHSLEVYKNFIEENITTFNKKYKLTTPKIAVNLLNKNEILYFYNMIDFPDKYNNPCLFINTYNDKIIKTNILESARVCETILLYIKKIYP